MIIQILFNALIAGSIYSLVAVGFSIIHVSRRFFDFSVAGSMILIGYSSFRVGDVVGGGLFVVCTAVVAITVILNYLLGRCIYRPLRGLASPPSVMLVASLGIMILLVNVVSLYFGDGPYRPAVFHFYRSLAFGGGRFTSLQLATFVISLLIGLIVSYVLEGSSFGVNLRAVASDEMLAKSLGMNLDYLELSGTWLGLLLVCVGVILMGLDVGLLPSTGFQLLIPAVTATVLGGIGNTKGAFAAAFIVGLLQQTSGALLGIAWQDAVLFAVLLAALFFKPAGLWRTGIRSMQA